MRPLEKLARLTPGAYSSLVEAGAGGVLGGAGGYTVDKLPGDRVLSKVAASPLTMLTEVGTGAALGGLGGYATEKKDEKGKRNIGKRTILGAAAGSLAGGAAGDVLRYRKFRGSFKDLFSDADRREQGLSGDLGEHVLKRLDKNKGTPEQLTEEQERLFGSRYEDLLKEQLTGNKFTPFGLGGRSVFDIADQALDESLKKTAATPLTHLTEAGVGAALGGLGGYATEKKDEKGKRSIGARTGLGALGGGALGSFGGALGRLYKVNPNKASAEVLSKGDRAKFRDSLSPENRAVLDQAETGYHPFGIGLKKAPPDLGPNWKRSPPEADGEKAASIAQYSVLFDKIDSGEFGPHVKEALFGVCEGLSSSLQSHHAKVASSPMQMTESQARQARLDQLLRKF